MRRAGRGTFPRLVTRDAVDRSQRAPRSRRASPKSLRVAIAGWIAVAAVASFGMDGHLEWRALELDGRKRCSNQPAVICWAVIRTWRALSR